VPSVSLSMLTYCCRSRLFPAQKLLSPKSQIEDHDKDNIWRACKSADEDAIRRHIKTSGAKVLKEKDSAGACSLHLLLLFNTDRHIELANWLIDEYPEVCSEQYTDSEQYEGENALHIAVVNFRNSIISKLVGKAPGLVAHKAKGKFFQPGAPCYYGGYPLSFAASTNNKEAADVLVRSGASLRDQDSYGNTALHLAVLHDHPQMYDWLMEKAGHELLQKGEPQFWDILNKERRTAFTLAAVHGKKRIFQHMLQTRTEVQWVYGPVKCMALPLDGIDMSTAGNRSEYQDVLHAVVENMQLEILMLPEVKDVITKKWDRYGRDLFRARFIDLLVEVVAFNLFILVPFSSECTLWNMTHFFIECCLVGLGTHHILVEMKTVDEHVNSQCEFEAMSYKYARVLYAASLIVAGILRAMPVQAVPARALHDMCWAFGVLFAWGRVLYYMTVWSVTGPFVIMIGEMISSDLFSFMSLFLTFLVSFSSAFFLIFDLNKRDIGEQLTDAFASMVGGADFEKHMGGAMFPRVSGALHSIYVIIVTILLLNMLIGKMGHTFDEVYDHAKERWTLERARMLLSLDMSMSDDEISTLRWWVDHRDQHCLEFETQLNNDTGHNGNDIN